MKSRNVTYSLLFVLAVLGFAIFRKLQEPGRKEAFNREPAKVLFTAYVLCRMDCYALSSADILLIMSKRSSFIE